MKILRSLYLKLQSNSVGREQNVSNKNGVKKIVHSQGKERPKDKQGKGLTGAPAQLQDKKVTLCCNENPINISFGNVDESFQDLNVVVEYVDMRSLWLTNVYKTFENDMWCKKPYLNIHGNKKWLFYCGLCSNEYKMFCSLKSHLNRHLKVYPYVCKICLKKFTDRKAATIHLKKYHQLTKEQWNDFLTI